MNNDTTTPAGSSATRERPSLRNWLAQQTDRYNAEAANGTVPNPPDRNPNYFSRFPESRQDSENGDSGSVEGFSREERAERTASVARVYVTESRSVSPEMHAYLKSLGVPYGLELLIYDALTCSDPDGVVASYDFLGVLFGADARNRNADLGSALQEIVNQVPGLSLTDYARGRCRRIRVDRTQLAPSIRPGLATPSARPEDRVDLRTGKPMKKSRRVKPPPQSMSEAQRRVCDLMEANTKEHSKPATRLLRSNLDAVEAAIARLPEEKRERCAEAIAKMQAIGADPYYRVSETERTMRLFAHGASLNSQPRSVRKAGLRGGADLDLRACHLAILCALLSVPEVVPLLEDPRGVWNVLLDYFGVPEGDRTDAKQALKDAVIPMCYGAGDETLTAHLAEFARIIGCTTGSVRARFYKHPALRPLRAAISDECAWIESHPGGATDAYGKWIDLPEPKKNPRTGQWSSPGASVLSTVAQSWEMKLMWPLVECAEAALSGGTYANGFRVVCWQHDGVTISFRSKDEGRRARVVRYLQCAVDENARTLLLPNDAIGIPTRLEVEHLR